MRSSLRINRALLLCGALLVAFSAVSYGVPRAGLPKAPLTGREIDQIATLTMLEDQRSFDSTVLAGLLAANHPEVRRRAAQSVGRIADKRGIGLLLARPLDADTAVAATTVWAVGQLRDTSTVHWLDSVLTKATMPTVAAEAATGLGKIKSSGAREVLARYLLSTRATPRTTPALEAALYSIGRTPRGDLAPILQWTTASDDELRFRSTWALARLKDPAGVVTLLRLSQDKLPLLRSWAVRGLIRPVADSAGLGAEAEARLLVLANDSDRRVATEAIRALSSFASPVAIARLISALQSADNWIAGSAAEGLGNLKSSDATPALRASTTSAHSCALRVVAMQALQKYIPLDAMDAAVTMARDSAVYCRTMAVQLLRGSRNTLPEAGTPQRTAIDAILNDTTLAPRPQPRQPGTPVAPRPLEEYRALVVRWVVPDYEGKARPVARWETTRGTIELELAPGDAPLAVEEFVRLTTSGLLVGTQFTRVVPDFVDQQESIRGAKRLRDEVNRRGLTRGNLAWATAGLDTGSPGYTLNHTPQPHNEGDFTSMGRITRGQDVADRIELGDRILTAKMLTKESP